MGGYVIRRVLQAMATLFLLSIIFFLLTRAQPGGPCAGRPAGCITQLHLDEPLSSQYVYWIVPLLHGDLGTSAVSGQSIDLMIQQKLPPTILLVGCSLILQQFIALPLGMLAALRPYSKLDQTLTLGSYVALSLPAFFVAFLLIYLFGLTWVGLPIGHDEDVALPLLGSGAWFAALWQDPGYVLGDALRHLILPVATLTLTGIAVDSRFMRAAMLQVLHQDYIRTAKAKGLRRRRIIFKHAFRNALLPIITNLGLYLPALIGGVVVVEAVFTWGGLGYAFDQAINGGFIGMGDLPVLQALVMLSALAVVIANLLADLAYAWLDPRIRFETRGDEG